jgi:hypothetical protein
MADSIRQQIVSAFKTRIQTIKISNGYETNIGNNIFEWKTTDFQESELPGADIRDTGEEVEVRGGNHIYTLTIELEAKITGATMATQARDIIADCMKAIGVDPRLGGLVQETKPVNNESLGFEQKDKKIGSLTMKFTLTYITRAFSPYTLA